MDLRTVDTMTLDEVERVTRYTSRNPPVRAMVAAYLGIKPKDARPQDLGELVSMFHGGVIR